MKTILLSLCVFLLGVVNAQGVCDNLEIIQVNVDTFNENRLNITVENNSSEIFSYPGFRVYDENNNLIGEEEVFFFGIPGESTHSVYFDNSEFFFEAGQSYNLKLELWTGFYDILACEFESNFFLIPEDVECLPVEIIFAEYSEDEVIYTIELTDYWGNIIHEEDLLFQSGVSSISRNFCLNHSCFFLNASSSLNPDQSILIR